MSSSESCHEYLLVNMPYVLNFFCFISLSWKPTCQSRVIKSGSIDTFARIKSLNYLSMLLISCFGLCEIILKLNLSRDAAI